MTNDEAFIRAIVDAPGDDAPRLVYADWLDERGDPRGAYMRATVIWGRRLHDVETREKAERQLRHAARSLDPVWVCRLTPPPLGVCCDRVRFHDCGSPIPAGRIDQLEARLRIRLPPDYRAFLLNYNGGTPEPDVYQVGWDHFSRVQAFFPLGERLTGSSGQTSDDSLEAYAERINAPIGRMTLFPVAAVLASHRPGDELDVESSRAAHEGETCLCIRLDTQEIVGAHMNLSPALARIHVPFLLEPPVARSLPILLGQLDELPEGWEPYVW
ncbi:MAG: TIGR02996 domain-containing protein [Zavarzinella sp.]|nr:TIGR02996 domain-containing protein [Zavarzinella sp.]